MFLMSLCFSEKALGDAETGLLSSADVKVVPLLPTRTV